MSLFLRTSNGSGQAGSAVSPFIVAGVRMTLGKKLESEEGSLRRPSHRWKAPVSRLKRWNMGPRKCLGVGCKSKTTIDRHALWEGRNDEFNTCEAPNIHESDACQKKWPTVMEEIRHPKSCAASCHVLRECTRGNHRKEALRLTGQDRQVSLCPCRPSCTGEGM